MSTNLLYKTSCPTFLRQSHHLVLVHSPIFSISPFVSPFYLFSGGTTSSRSSAICFHANERTDTSVPDKLWFLYTPRILILSLTISFLTLFNIDSHASRLEASVPVASIFLLICFSPPPCFRAINNVLLTTVQYILNSFGFAHFSTT